MKRPICHNGHDTAITGRDDNGHCIACRGNMELRRFAAGRLPFAPLEPWIASAHLPHSSAMARRLQRARQRGVVTLECADEFAVRHLGMHPMEIWGSEWETA